MLVKLFFDTVRKFSFFLDCLGQMFLNAYHFFLDVSPLSGRLSFGHPQYTKYTLPKFYLESRTPYRFPEQRSLNLQSITWDFLRVVGYGTVSYKDTKKVRAVSMKRLEATATRAISCSEHISSVDSNIADVTVAHISESTTST